MSVTWKSTSTPYLSPTGQGQPDAWTRETKGRGAQRILSAGHCAASAETGAALRVAEGGLLVYRSRLILFDDQPVEVVNSYYPAAWASGTALAESARIKGGAVRLVAELGWIAAKTIDDDSAETVADLPADLAGVEAVAAIPTGVPLLVVRRLSVDAAGVPFEYAIMPSWDGRRQRYVLEAE